MRQHRQAWLKRLFKEESSRRAADTDTSEKGAGQRLDQSSSRSLASPDDTDVIIDDDDNEKAVAESQHGIRNPYPQHIRMALLDWLKRNRHSPYVSSSEEYRMLREKTGLNNGQIKVSRLLPFCLFL